MAMKKKAAVAAAILATTFIGSEAFALAITTTNNANTLANNLVGGGVTISNATYTGAAVASGTFTGGLASGIGIDTGIILTTGSATNAIGPNNLTNASTDNGTPGLASLTALIPGFSTNDAVALDFDFTSAGGNLFFNYVFASEEYNEFVNTSFNDVFAFFLDGVNIATIPGSGGTPVSINNLNCGNPFGTANNFCSLFVNNTGAFNIQYDGFTKVLTAQALGLSGGTHHLTLAIADAGDHVLDSAVFFQAGSLSDTPTNVPEPSGVLMLAGGLLAFAMTRRRLAASKK